MTRLLITGATGYLGQCFVKEVLRSTDWEIISLQRNWGGANQRVKPIPYDIRSPLSTSRWAPDPVDYIVHLAADVHALRSLKDPSSFVQTNIIGTFNLLEAARVLKPKKFVYMSTAEVLGGRDEGYSKEDDQLRPSNPYAATKAAGELLAYSYFKAFEVPVVTVRTMNLWGPTQIDETKYVPMVRKMLLAGEEIQIHTKDNKPGVRQWITGEQFVRELLRLIESGVPGETYHVVGEEKTNLQVAQEVADKMNLTMKYRLVEQPRTHEHRYAIVSTKP
jgi:dTDP-glucose 4,6-dehydratase